MGASTGVGGKPLRASFQELAVSFMKTLEEQLCKSHPTLCSKHMRNSPDHLTTRPAGCKASQTEAPPEMGFFFLFCLQVGLWDNQITTSYHLVIKIRFSAVLITMYYSTHRIPTYFSSQA